MIRILTGLISIGFFLLPLHADDATDASPTVDPGDVFAIQGGTVLTQDEIDAAFSKIPAEFRLAYIRDGTRVNQLVQQLLRRKIVAGDAIAAHYNEEPVIKNRMLMAAEKELAAAWTEKIIEDAPEADYEALAHEHYLANPDSFMTAEIVDVSHILVNNEDRSSEEALELALSLREQLLEDPARFEDMVTEYSDDPSKGANGGRFPRTERGQMVRAFEEMAFSMEEIGAISEPVETAYGYHIIRLNERFAPRLKPFEDIKAKAMEQARQAYLAEYRSRYLRKLLSEPIEIPEQAVAAMARRYYGENLERAPVYEE